VADQLERRIIYGIWNTQVVKFALFVSFASADPVPTPGCGPGAGEAPQIFLLG